MKSSHSKLVSLSLIQFCGLGVAIPAVIFLPLPAPASWIYLAIGTGIHLLYQFLLIMAYRAGDFSYSYPIARGSGPLIVLLASPIFLGEELGIRTGIGAMTISIGIILLARTNRRTESHKPHALYFAVLTGCSIGAYTLVDGAGARLSGNALSYVAWLNILETPLLCILASYRHRRRFAIAIATEWKKGLLGGFLAFTGYALVMWAVTFNTIASIAALRETSVVFAAIIGARFFKEPFGKWRTVASVCVAIGIVLLAST